MQLRGIHHLTAITANLSANHAFYTRTLGLRLVKRTVNQDDVSAYHLFYADGRATPGTDITFFDWPLPRERRGTHSIVRTGFRVATADTLRFWLDRFIELGVTHGQIADLDGRATLDFEDGEGQRLRLVVADDRTEAHPWEKSPIPAEHQLRGLGPITISVPEVGKTDMVLTRVMNMRYARDYIAPPTSGAGGAGNTVHVYEMGDGGAGAELHVAVEPNLPPASQGAGAVHHVAFRVPSFQEYDLWNARLSEMRIPSSGPVDRFYFRSLYFREPNGILFELATDGPGFDADEPMDALGERLALPPFLEPRRKEIEAGLKPM
ncbi:MAG TPA: ring-cleaving dioxygenase [Tepidisphaeraceae bacterium]|nr:ring-cleaving dioxygenase [Tepidisphaeraceae bacterium]